MIHRTEWEPGCAAGMRTVNKLIKYEVTKKVPTYTWKVEYCCDGCCSKMALEDAAHGTPTDASVLSMSNSLLPAPTLAPPAASQPADRAVVEQASYETPDTTPKHSLPWDKMFK